MNHHCQHIISLHLRGCKGEDLRITCINGHWSRSGGWRERRAVDWELLRWEELKWELLKWEELKWELQLCKEGDSQLFVSPTSS